MRVSKWKGYSKIGGSIFEVSASFVVRKPYQDKFWSQVVYMTLYDKSGTNRVKNGKSAGGMHSRAQVSTNKILTSGNV